MTADEKQLARFLKIHLNGAREAIKVANLKTFKDLDAELKKMINTLKDGGDVC